MDYSSAYPWAKKELLKETSVYTTHLKIRELRELRACLSKKHESLVKVVECKEGEPICNDKLSHLDGPFCFFQRLILHQSPTSPSIVNLL